MPRTSPAKVVLLSTHELILHDLQQFLRPSFNVRSLKLRLGISDLGGLRIPKNRLCVVDGNGPASVIEALVSTIIKSHPEMRIIVLVEELTEASSFPLLRIGIKGLVKYEAVKSQLIRALQMVAGGGYWLPRDLLARFVELVLQERRTRPTSNLLLSGREREVLSRLMDNLSNKEIGSQLNISERTVKFHVSNLLAKFGVQRRADLIVLGYQNSHIDSETPRPVLLKTAKANGA